MFGVSGFLFRASCFVFRVSCFVSRVSCFVLSFQHLTFGFRVSVSETRGQGDVFTTNDAQVDSEEEAQVDKEDESLNPIPDARIPKP